MPISLPFNLMKWIEDRRPQMKPSAAIWQDGDLILQVIAGPSSRSDYHVDDYEEIFHQLKGEMTIRVIENGAAETLCCARAISSCCRRLCRTRHSGLRAASDWCMSTRVQKA